MSELKLLKMKVLIEDIKENDIVLNSEQDEMYIILSKRYTFLHNHLLGFKVRYICGRHYDFPYAINSIDDMKQLSKYRIIYRVKGERK